MNERQKHPDKKNANSILLASENQMNYTLKIDPNNESAFNIIRNIYECFRMLGDALLISRGIFSEDHVTQINAVTNLKVKTQRSINIIDRLRRMRHNINYYGYTPDKLEAEDVISFAQDCFKPLLDAVKKEIELNTKNRRFFND